MTGRIKAPKRKYEPQEPHTAEDCHINDAPHNHPDMDCGHYVASGPGYQMDQDAAMVGRVILELNLLMVMIKILHMGLVSSNY